MNIRIAIVGEIAGQIGAKMLVNELCDRCQSPLVEKPEQGMPFCWMCVTDKICAQRGHDVLTKAKMAACGIILEDLRGPGFIPESAPVMEGNSFFKFGMPL